MDDVKVAGMELGEILTSYPQEVETQLKRNLFVWESDARDKSKKFAITLTLALILFLGAAFIPTFVLMAGADDATTMTVMMISSFGVMTGLVLFFVARRYSVKKEKARAKAEKKNALTLTLLLMRKNAMYRVCKTHWMCHKCGKWFPQGEQRCSCGTLFDMNLSNYRFQRMIQEVNQLL